MTSGSIVLRSIDVGHLTEIMAIERHVFVQPWSASMMRDSLLAAHTNSYGLFCGDELLAFVVYGVILDEAELLSMAVAPAHQRRGFGAKLLQSVLAKLQRSEVEHLYLEVRNSNLPAINLYKNHSFEVIGERKGYYNPLPGQSAKEDALLMARKL